MKFWSREVTPYYEMIFPAKIIWRGEILSRSPIHRKIRSLLCKSFGQMMFLGDININLFSSDGFAVKQLFQEFGFHSLVPNNRSTNGHTLLTAFSAISHHKMSNHSFKNHITAITNQCV